MSAEGQSVGSYAETDRFRDEKRRGRLRKTAGIDSHKAEKSAENPTEKEEKKSEEENRDKS